MGGASSIDIDGGILDSDDPELKAKKRELDKQGKLYRINHISWWEQKMPSQDEFELALCKLNNVNYKVDFIITHCCSNSTMDNLQLGIKQRNKLTGFLERIKNTVEYKKWYFGHYHNDININAKEVLLYNQIIELGVPIPDNISILGQPKYSWNQAVKFKDKVGIIDIIDAYGTFGQPYESSYDIRSFLDDDICIYQHNKESDVKPLTDADLILYDNMINTLRASKKC